MFPLSSQLLEAPASLVELAYESSKRMDVQEGIFSSIMSKDDACFHDIHEVELPENLCPFGCKKKVCPGYDFDAEKCPHDLAKKSLPELSEYAIKAFYYGDEDFDTDKRMSKQVDPKLLEAIQQIKRPGNTGRVITDGSSRPDNNKV